MMKSQPRETLTKIYNSKQVLIMILQDNSQILRIKALKCQKSKK